jgi:hypothetical protein
MADAILEGRGTLAKDDAEAEGGEVGEMAEAAAEAEVS